MLPKRHVRVGEQSPSLNIIRVLAHRFRGIVVAEPPQMGDAGLEAFEATLRYHCERLNPDPDLKIDASTSRCKWLGERMDYSTAIEAMQFREEAAKTAAAPS